MARAIFSQASSEYTYTQARNQIQIYFNDSLVTTILLQRDGEGAEFIFANGSANAMLSDGAMTIGKASFCVAIDDAGSFDSNLVIPAPSDAIVSISEIQAQIDDNDIATIATSSNIPKNCR